MHSHNVPDIIVGRLPIYLRALTEMDAMGQAITSSQELAERLGISSAQIRKDLSQFGEFGKQGTGYHIRYLADQLRKILTIDRIWDIALVGVGHLGTAVANYGGFFHRGFRVTAIYDNDPQKIGQRVGPFTILDARNMTQDIRQRGIRIGMISVPAQNAQEVSEALVQAGVQAILCYAPTSITVPDHIQVKYIDPVLHLQHMTYYLD